MSRRWKVIALAGVLALLTATNAGAEDYRRIGGRLLLSYTVPVLSLRSNWYSSAVRYGGSVVYNMDSRVGLEFEYHRMKYSNAKIEDRAFVWNVDGAEYMSSEAAASMRMNSLQVNALLRLGSTEGLFIGQGTSPYVLAGGGFHHYRNKVTGLIYPGQTAEPLDATQLLPDQEDRRSALGVNLGFGVERFLSKNFALDFRMQYNFMVGTLSPREAWGVKEVWPMQMLDLEVAFKFYESGD
ncbi:MAG: outer membrane beta-barrel protein [Candidatus Latescibacteria bacterium]|nr:outer membrane beta-barrel protein [Candidatus Latescibacterota bacterium]